MGSFLELPWQEVADADAATASNATGAASSGNAFSAEWTEGKESPHIVGSTKPLPVRGCPYEAPGGQRRNYWLPVPSQHDVMDYRVQDGDSDASRRFNGFIVKQAPREGGADDGGAETDSEKLYHFVDEMVRNMQHLRWRAVEMRDQQRDAWDSRKLPTLPIAWLELAGVLAPSDEPRVELVVRFMEEFEKPLFEMVARPRAVLARERDKVRVGRVQQVDSACLAWLVRQPGRTQLEKAGPKQEILGIVRRESVDILENRVLKDLARRAYRSASDWLRTNREKHRTHETYLQVARFQRRLRHLLREDPWRRISRLKTVPTPNYVLRHDRLYREVWRWYLDFVQKEQDLDLVWPWQGRLWAETVGLFVAATLVALQGDDWKLTPVFHQRLWIRDRPESGQWLVPDDWPAALEVTNPRGERFIATLLPISTALPTFERQHCRLGEYASTLGADYALHVESIDGSRHLLCAIWTLHGAAHRCGTGALEALCLEAASALARNPEKTHGVIRSGLVVCSGFSASAGVEVEHMAREEKDGCAVYGLVAPPELIQKADDFLDWTRDILIEMASAL